MSRRRQNVTRQTDSTPICRCRVLYLGSSVPHITKDGLQGIQEPLRQLYPHDGVVDAGGGIDSWLSVWSNGLLLENVNERLKRVTRFFPIETLHYCAAVRHVVVPPPRSTSVIKDSASLPPVSTPVARFLPLDSPFARAPPLKQAPLFAAILRRTSGIKVLECHAFVCRRDAPANALVRCCFHAFADSVYARQLDGALFASIYSGLPVYGVGDNRAQSIEQVHMEVGTENGDDLTDGRSFSDYLSINGGGSGGSGNDDENHKVWTGRASRSTTDGPVFIESDPLPSESLHSHSTRASRPRQRLMPATPAPPALSAFRRSASHPPPQTAAGDFSRTGPPQRRHRRVERRSQPPPQQQRLLYSPPLVYTTAPHPVSPHIQLLSMLPAQCVIPHTVEEPVYMPSARAGSPTASYQPSHFPYTAYLSQQRYNWDEASQRRRRRHTANSPRRPAPLSQPVLDPCLDWQRTIDPTYSGYQFSYPAQLTSSGYHPPFAYPLDYPTADEVQPKANWVGNERRLKQIGRPTHNHCNRYNSSPWIINH